MAFNIAAGDILGRYTFYGDTDLNQVIDFDDYGRTGAGFNIGAGARGQTATSTSPTPSILTTTS